VDLLKELEGPEDRREKAAPPFLRGNSGLQGEFISIAQTTNSQCTLGFISLDASSHFPLNSHPSSLSSNAVPSMKPFPTTYIYLEQMSQH
jgi:hypothetical protein